MINMHIYVCGGGIGSKEVRLLARLIRLPKMKYKNDKTVDLNCCTQ